MKKLGFLLLTIVVLFVACQEDDSNPATPADEPQINISFIGMPDSISAPEGVVREMSFQVAVEQDGIAVVGKSIDLSVSTGTGTVNSANLITDENGSLNAVYSTTITPGLTQTVLVANWEGHVARHNLTIFGSASPSKLNISLYPTVVRGSVNGEAQVSFSVIVVDSTNIGVPNTKISFSLSPYSDTEVFGTLAAPNHTDNQGHASATFYSQGFSELHRSVLIQCRVDEGDDFLNVQDTQLLTVLKESTQDGSLTLITDNISIYADNGITFSRLTATLTDRDNLPINDAEIVFTANNNGTVTLQVVTDTSGVATAVFRDIGLPSGVFEDGELHRAPSLVTASYAPLGLASTVFIDIAPVPEIHEIILTAGAMRMYSDSDDSAWVRATCFADSLRRQPVPDGTIVEFTAEGLRNEDAGYFTQSTVQTIGGVAQTWYHAGERPNRVAIKAGNGENVVSNEWVMHIQAHGPTGIDMSWDPPIQYVGDVARVVMRMIDENGDLFDEDTYQIDLSSMLGRFDPAVVHTVDGIGITHYYAEAPGLEQITLTTETADGPVSAQSGFVILGRPASRIELTANPLELDVANVPGMTVSTLRATLRDDHGNLVVIPTMVVFQLITGDEPPQACNINNNPFDFSSDTTFSVNGVAVATLNSGTKVGPQLIRAYSLNPDSTETGVTATNSQIRVVGGPPSHIVLNYNPRGIDAGGGTWSIEVSALIRDMLGNPALDSIPVLFSISPDIASIQNGTTGNRSRDGITTPGVAYSQLIYNSNNTFDTIRVAAYCRTEQVDSIGGELTFALPLQGDARLSLHADPGNFQFERDGNDTAIFRVWAMVSDGHDILINNAPILFTATRGHFYYVWRLNPSPAFKPFDGLVRRRTGPGNDGLSAGERQADNDRRGEGVVWLRGSEADFFIDDQTNEVIVEINAEIEGCDNVQVDPVQVIVTRR